MVCIAGCAAGSITLRSVVSRGWILVRPTSSRMALSATALMVSPWFLMLKAKSSGWAGSICQITRNLTSAIFSSPVSIRLSSGTSDQGAGIGAAPRADVDGIAVGDVELDDGADRLRPDVVQAGTGLAGITAENQIEANLVGIDGIEAAGEPQQNERGEQYENAARRKVARRSDCSASPEPFAPRLRNRRWGWAAASAAAPRGLGTVSCSSDRNAPGIIGGFGSGAFRLRVVDRRLDCSRA